MKNKLLPCPFCGKQPTICNALQSWWRVQCWDMDKHMVNVYRKSRKAAIAAWNRRTNG